ncbi:MAG TPA: hypothetical protein VK689_14955, partial [Armatimonadota bacterium]|nr:hypothetical protein [Armatimonadota bacterium]
MKRSRPLRHALCATVLAATPAAAQAVLPPAPPEAVPAGAVPAEAPPENPPSVAVPQPTPPTTQEAQPASTTEAAQAGPAEGAQPAAPANPAPATPAAPAAQEPIISVGEVQIFGDDFEMDPQTGLTTVTGNPRAVRGDEEIRATRMIINPRTRQFTAEGDVIIRQAGREFRTTRATYNFDEQTGQVEDVRTVLKNYHVRAGQLLLKPGPRYEGRRTRFTTCDREHPHYSIFARSLEIVPEQYLEARHASLSLMGLRLLTIPRLRKSLRPRDDDDDGRSLIPSIGYNSYNGPYVRDQFQLRTKNPVWIDADVQLNTFNEPNAGIRAATPGRLQYVGSLFYRDIAENQRAPHLQVSRLPELGVVWRPGQVPRPGQFLPHQVPGVRYPRELDISTNWRFAGQITGGFFRQHRGDRTNLHDSESTSAARLSVQGQGVLPVLRA